MTLNVKALDLSWHDEFNGSELDTTKWIYEENFRHEAQNSRDAVFVENGCLNIGIFTKNKKHHTAIISTEGKFEAAKGYWEVRARFNDKPGTWSDAWLYSSTVPSIIGNVNKAGMEIDIFEHRSHNQNGKNISSLVTRGMHWDGYEEHHKNVAIDHIIEPGFHTYGLLWTDSKYEFYYDDVMMWSAGPTTTKPLHFLLSTEVGYLPYWTIKPLDNFHNVTMQVDYVRYYH